jgi:hypothetical protein
MFLNIITPCARPFNLKVISESINIPRDMYRWIVVFDSEMIPSDVEIPENAETYCHTNSNSTVGHAQRNFALDRIEKGHVYMNDDDTTIHPDLWGNIKDLDEDFISFAQNWPDGSLRLQGDVVALNYIDSHNFIVANRIIGDRRWIIHKYCADGVFAQECYEHANTKVHIAKVLSIYNKLR